MAKQLLAFVALLILQGVALSEAVPKSSGTTAFDEWLKTFDPSTAVASKIADCVGKKNGFYPGVPGSDTDLCSADFTVCVSERAFPESCNTGDVFDSTVSDCVNRYLANSKACENFPVPVCTERGLHPKGFCSDLYYRCADPGVAPIEEFCRPAGLPDTYFDPITLTCKSTASVAACEVVIEPVYTIPPYNCVDKLPGYAYAIAECSVSFYTCERAGAPSPTPQSCLALDSPAGGAGKIFNYKTDPVLLNNVVCIDRGAECTTSFLGSL